MASERHVALDGMPYTRQEFLDYYGDPAGPRVWNERPPEQRRVALADMPYSRQALLEEHGDREGRRLWVQLLLRYCGDSEGRLRVQRPAKSPPPFSTQPSTKPHLKQLHPTDKDFDMVFEKFHKSWRPETWRGSSVDPPPILNIYQLGGAEAARRVAEARGGQQVESMYFHGTRLECCFSGEPCASSTCNVCGIIKDGKFLLSKVGSSSETMVWGRGLYFTSGAHTAKGYGMAPGKQAPPWNKVDFVPADAGNAVFVAVSLAMRPEHLTAHGYTGSKAARTMDPPEPTKYDSRIVKKTTGNDELVLFEEGLVKPAYLIVFGSRPVPRQF